MLVLLDLSAVLDTIDHGVLRDKALSWIAHHLSAVLELSKFQLPDGTFSMKFDLESGVPKGSCLEPWPFIVYASRIFEIVDKHNLQIHCYADDNQLYLSFCPSNIANQEAALASVESCIEDSRD